MVLLDVGDMSFRLLLTFLLSLSFGLERQLNRKHVAFGVFTMVATGSCLLTIVALRIAELAFESSPLPLLSGIITGVGFLGAGAIIHYQEKAFGFTTAAAIWAFAAIGMAVGAGFLQEGILFYLLILVVISFDHMLERRGLGNYSRTITVVFDSLDRIQFLKDTILKEYKCRENVECFNLEGKCFKFSFVFSGHMDKLDEMVTKLVVFEGLKELDVEKR
jgi:putative Mg2+ transporter-C (MgtC) family protein